MKNRKTILILCFTYLLMSVNSFGQDMHFSQFFEAPLWRNPSLAGIFNGDVRIQAVYRDQWNSITDAYKTGSFNAEIKKPIGQGNDFITTGAQILYDKSGTIGWSSTYVLPVLNYHKSLSGDRMQYLSLGCMGGWVEKKFDASKMTTDNMYETGSNNEPLAATHYSYWDATVGLSYNASFGLNQGNSFFVGAAYHHFAKPRNSFYKNNEVSMTPKLVFSAGFRMNVSDFSYVTIQADHSSQGGHQETVGGALCGLKLGSDPDNAQYTIHAGAFLRWNDALIPVVKLDFNPVSVSVSYDVNISKLKPTSYGRGGFELSLSYTGFIRKTDQSLLCPGF